MAAMSEITIGPMLILKWIWGEFEGVDAQGEDEGEGGTRPWPRDVGMCFYLFSKVKWSLKTG